MLDFKVDMESEALKTLSRLANLPTTRLARFAGRLAASQVKREVYPEAWSKKVNADSEWQKFKNRMAGVGKQPGFLTGSAYSGIQIISLTQYGATVGLKGSWPSESATMPQWATVGGMLEEEGEGISSVDYSNLDAFIKRAIDIMTEEERQIFQSMGAQGMARLREKGREILKGMGKKTQREEYINIDSSGIQFGMRVKDDFIEKEIPSEDLSTKSFGTARKGGSYETGAYEKQTPAVDFMYLRASDADVIMDGIGRAIDMVMRASIREIKA